MSDQENDDDQFDPSEMIGMGGEGEDYELAELLGSLLSDEDGNNIVDAMAGIKSQLEMTNKLLLKLVAHLTKIPPS